MIKADWNIFNAKFSDNPQNNFEWLIYSLFCREFNCKTGIFRYKNQRGVETDLIKVDDQYIGWQAKYYETSLGSHKKDFLDMLTDTSESYPQITKLIVFTNAEWGQSKGKPPAGKLEIEKYAKQLDIELEWRCRSYFETPDVISNNLDVYAYFFSLSQSVYEKLEQLDSHAERLISRTSSYIYYDKKKINIDRESIKKTLLASSNQIVIISGNGGVGKTAIVKDIYDSKTVDSAYYIHKATEFEVSKVEDFLQGISLKDFIKVHENVANKVIIIDSSENLLGIKNLEPFKEYLEALISSQWKVWFTTRDQFLSDFSFTLIEAYILPYEEIKVPPLTDTQLAKIAKDNKIDLPHDEKLKDLLTNIFYLNEYLKFYEINKLLDYRKFRDSLWPKVISKSDPKRSQAFIEIATQRANTGHYFVNIGVNTIDSGILDQFIKEGILINDQMHYFIAHDIYEEWALNQYIELQYNSLTQVDNFFSELKQSLPVRRAFRKWLSEKLDSETCDIIDFITDCMGSASIPKIWLDEVLVSILLSENSKFFFDSYKEALLDKDSQIFISIATFLRMSCKQIDDSILKNLVPFAFELKELSFMFTKPKGNGWNQFIDFVFSNLDRIDQTKFKYIVPILKDWNLNNKVGETTKKAGLIAIKIYKDEVEQDSYPDPSSDLLLAIINSVQENQNAISELIDLAIANRSQGHRNPHRKLSEILLSKLEGWNCAAHLPEKIRELAEAFWFRDVEEERQNFRSSSLSNNRSYRMIHDSYQYSPASSYQTPAYVLLKYDFVKSLTFIIKIINQAIEHASQYKEYEVITLQIDDREVKQYIDSHLWLMYRGNQVCPDILISLHMALEKCLLERVKKLDEVSINSLLKSILILAKSASITAIVASVAMSCYKKCFETIKILVSNKQILLSDNIRFRSEEVTNLQFKQLHTMLPNYSKSMHYKEREDNGELKHRKNSLDHVMRYFLFFREEDVSEQESLARIQDLYAIIDNFYKEIEEEAYADKTWKIFLNKIDRRLMQPSLTHQDNQILVDFNPQIPEELQEFQNQQLNELNEKTKYIRLDLWVRYRLEGNEKSKEYPVYESNPLKALEEVKAIWSAIKDQPLDENLENYKSLPALTCMVLVRDFYDQLGEELLYCADIIERYSSEILFPNYRYGIEDGVLEAATILPKLLHHLKNQRPHLRSLLVVLLLKPVSYNVAGSLSSDSIVYNILKYLSSDYDEIISIYKGFLYLENKKQLKFAEYQESRTNIFEKLNYGEFFVEFLESIDSDIDIIESGKINDEDFKDFHIYHPRVLITIFKFSLFNNRSEKKIPYTNEILDVLLPAMIKEDRSNDGEKIYDKFRFFPDYATYLLETNSIAELKERIQPILLGNNISQGYADLINELVKGQDRLNKTENFWYIWDSLKEKIIYISNKYGFRFDSEKIIGSYMFANTPWKDTAKHWPAFTPDKNFFFRNLTNELGANFTYLMSLIKLIEGIGTIYQEESLYWLSKAINENAETLHKHRDFKNLIFDLESLLRKFCIRNKQKIKTVVRLKNAISILLDFLVSSNSVTGYLLREDVN